MATKNSKHVHVVEFTYKQAITDTFGTIPFLPLQLIYGGRKTAQNSPKLFCIFWNIPSEWESQTFLEYGKIVEVTRRNHHFLDKGWTRKVEIGTITTCINDIGCI